MNSDHFIKPSCAPDFMFQLTREEILGISQIVTSSKLKFSKRVTAFTEQGVAMLSSGLRSNQAIAVNVEWRPNFNSAYLGVPRRVGGKYGVRRYTAEPPR